VTGMYRKAYSAGSITQCCISWLVVNNNFGAGHFSYFTPPMVCDEYIVMIIYCNIKRIGLCPCCGSSIAGITRGSITSNSQNNSVGINFSYATLVVGQIYIPGIVGC